MGSFIKKYLTIDDLLVFCESSKMDCFSAKEAGGPIIVQSFGKIKMEDTTMAGLTPCTLYACHTELNKNKSFIEDEVMNNALDSFANRPILGYIHQLDDGSWNFWDHRVAIEEDGDNTRIEYLERPIGVIPESCNAHLEYDDKQRKNYVVVNGYIYDDYGNRAIDIIKDNDGQVDVSVELAINSMSYNGKENYLNIEDFTFMGVTCLGKTPDGDVVMPGMEGSHLKLENFSVKKNSMFADSMQEKMIEVLDKLNATLSSFNNTTNSEKGGEKVMNKFEELLEKYGKTADEVTFEYENLSDEELEVAFKEAFEEAETEPEVEVVAEGEGAEEVVVEETATEVVTEEVDDDKDADADVDVIETVAVEEGFTLQYKLSHDDIRTALYSLLAAVSEDGYYYTWIVEVYDNEFIYHDYMEDKFYRQDYSKDGDNVALGENKIEVFNEWLSKDERDALETLKADYAALKSFKENYEVAELKAKKDAIFAREEYAVLADNEAFKKLVKEAEKYSVDEIESAVKYVFADHIINTGTFSVKNDGENKATSIGFNFKAEPETTGPYGDLFNK